MGLFQHKQTGSPRDEATAEVEQFLNDDFREELREHGRLYFERLINENAALFKQDLDATVAHINTELRQHVARQLDSQFTEISKVNADLKDHIAKQLDEQSAEYGKTMQQAQNLALDALNRSAQSLQEQHQQLAASLEKSVAHQDAVLTSMFQDSAGRISELSQTQEQALQTIKQSVATLETKTKELAAQIEQRIADQEAAVVSAFEQNMAQIVEHYLLEALGDEYDLKAQLPSIIKQLEANKQAIMDDMKL